VYVRARARICGCGCTGGGVCLNTCSLTNPTCIASPLWLHHIFLHYLINSMIFGKMLLSIKCAFWFSLQLLFETFLVVRRIQRVIVKNVKKSSCKIPVIFVWFYWSLNFLDRFSKKKSSNIKFNQNPFSDSRVVPCGQTDTKKLLFAIQIYVNAPKTWQILSNSDTWPALNTFVSTVGKLFELYLSPLLSVPFQRHQDKLTFHCFNSSAINTES
jgi:hypothetical protein